MSTMQEAVERLQVDAYEPYVIEVPPGAKVSEEGALTKVVEHEDHTGWSCQIGSIGFVIPRLPVIKYGSRLREPVVPEVGDHVRIYGTFGYPIRGIDVRGEVVFWRDDAMADEHHRRTVANMKTQDARRFVCERQRQDTEYAALHPLLKDRIDRFRAEKDDFRQRDEPYEMFCCTEAMKVAEHCKAQRPEDPQGYFEEMVKQDAPNGSIDPWWGQLIDAGVVSQDHTNNTFGGALSLARVLLRHEAGERVVL